ncbi:MAG TPA: phospho-N-acetylmuramoyl-pentapeptide-transferase [Thermoanaerobaculia bacterium]|nr:phospho-N-acetylmuramoyl-pentapeptide-transferase [Thermoanaerobaculia bacterium]
MLYHLLYPLSNEIGALNLFRYITFRATGAIVTALLISLFLGPWFVRQLRRLSVGQNIREVGPQAHFIKAGTPTMGGLLILFAVVVSTLLWSSLTNLYVWITLGVTVAFGTVGFLDDYLKVRREQNLGLTSKQKFGLQILAAGAAALALWWLPRWLPEVYRFDPAVAVPFLKAFAIPLGLAYIPFVVLVLVGSSNAVNLTDGLDGLAIGSTMIAAATYAVFTYVAGNRVIASYLQIEYVGGVGEVTVFCAALVGASLGFLWFNAHPADVFMGDVGSLSIGAAIGIVAILSKQEILLVLVGGIFVMEAVSVMVQVAAFKAFKRRVFRMSPLHHHFEMIGWAEPKIIVRFWILSLLFALVALSTLKLR